MRAITSKIVSAGNDPGQLDPEAITAMREIGIDISTQKAKSVTAYLGERFTYVITLCDRHRERSCPIFPGAIWRNQWDLENPAIARDHGAAVRRVRDQLREHILQFASEYR